MAGLFKATWEGGGLFWTGHECNFLWGAARLNYVNRIPNPESDRKTIVTEGNFPLKSAHFLVLVFRAEETSQPSDFESETTLSLIQAKVAVEPCDGYPRYVAVGVSGVLVFI